MTPSELAHRVSAAGYEPYFFSRDTMRFFGDTMRNYGCRQAKVTDQHGTIREVWELYRKHPVKHGVQSPAYFDRGTLQRVFPKKEWE